MAKRLTTFSKLLLTFVLLAVIFFAAQWGCNNTDIGKTLQNKAEEAQTQKSGSSTTKPTTTSKPKSDKKSGGLFGNKNSGSSGDDDVIKIGVVTWGLSLIHI